MFKLFKRQYRKRVKGKTTYRDLEKKLDIIFSEYIRLRDANDCGLCRCVTCGNWHFWKGGSLHNGHFISRRVKAVRFNEINCNSQCVNCNSYNQGKHHVYRDRLIEKYGKEEVEALEQEARLGGSLCGYQLQLMIDEYKEKVKKLKKEKGL